MTSAIKLYLSRGLSVFPTKREDKRPFFKWQQWAQEKASRQQWSAWWKKFPQCNVSVIYSSSDAPEGKQLVCVDTDTEAAEAWVASQDDFPATPTVQTCDGFHRYYFAPVGLPHYTGSSDRPEVRCGTHYSQLPPSVHPTGVVYSWLEGLSIEEVEIADLPAWGVALMEGAEEDDLPQPQAASEVEPDRLRKYGLAALQRTADELAAAGEGQRNSSLNKAAFSLGQLLHSGCFEEYEVRQSLLAACQTNGLLKDDGLTACEKTLESGLRTGKATPRELPEMPSRRNVAQRTAVVEAAPDDAALAEYDDAAEPGVYVLPVVRRANSDAPAALEDIAGKIIDDFDAECERDRVVRGLRTGFPALDNHFCGFYRQQLVIVHGPSGYGKSHFANHCIFSTALAEMQKPLAERAYTVVFMCEGLASNLLSSYLGYRWGVPERCRRAGAKQHMTPEIAEKIAEGKAEFGLLPICVTDNIKRLDEIVSDIRAECQRHRVAGVVIDHIQEVEAPGCENPSHQGVNKTVKTLRDLSEKELHIPIMALSQTTPDKAGNYNPQYGNAIREKSSLCFMVDRGLPGQKREEAVQSNVMRVVNDKARWDKVAPVTVLRGDYDTGRMWEEEEYERMQALRQMHDWTETA